MARFPPDTLRDPNSGESGTARATWRHVYVGSVGSLADFDGDWLGSSVADVAAIVHAGWMLDHLIDSSIEGVLPSTAISMQSVDDRFRVHELHSHREPWARALAAPPEVQEQAIAMVKAKAARHWSDALQSYSNLSMHAYGAAYRYARELIGGTEHLREWKESRRILAQWLMYANNVITTSGSDVPEIPAKALTSAQVGNRAGPDERYAKTTMRDDQRQAAIELAQVGYQAYKIQIEQGVPGATASEMAWAAHGPLRTKVAPVPPPRSYPPDPTTWGVTAYYYDKNGSDAVKLGVYRDSGEVMVRIAAHVWAPESDPATVVGDYDVVGSRGGMALTPVHVQDDLTMTYGDDPTPIDGMTIRDWLRAAGLPVPAQYVKKTVPRSKSKATKSKKWKVLASEQNPADPHRLRRRCPVGRNPRHGRVRADVRQRR